MADDEFLRLSPSSLSKFTDKNVRITLCEGKNIFGFVYTIDPVSYCVVLAENNDDSSSTNLIFVMGHAVKHIEINEQTTLQEKANFMEKFVNGSTKLYSEETLLERKNKLKNWLTKNRIPVLEDHHESLCVMDVAWIDPPYDSECCRSTNQIVLNRVRNLIDNIPT